MSKVYELNGKEQELLESKCIELKAITKYKLMRQDAIEEYTNEIEKLKSQSTDIISELAIEFGLTRFQVINKILVENRRVK